MSLAEEELSRASPFQLEKTKWTAICLMNTSYTYIAPNVFYTHKIEKSLYLRGYSTLLNVGFNFWRLYLPIASLGVCVGPFGILLFTYPCFFQLLN